MKPGKYVAKADLVVTLYRSNGGTQHPTENSYYTVDPGEEFEIPKTVNGFYYSVDKLTLQDDDMPIFVDPVQGQDYEPTPS